MYQIQKLAYSVRRTCRVVLEVSRFVVYLATSSSLAPRQLRPVHAAASCGITFTPAAKPPMPLRRCMLPSWPIRPPCPKILSISGRRQDAHDS